MFLHFISCLIFCVVFLPFSSSLKALGQQAENYTYKLLSSQSFLFRLSPLHFLFNLSCKLHRVLYKQDHCYHRQTRRGAQQGAPPAPPNTQTQHILQRRASFFQGVLTRKSARRKRRVPLSIEAVFGFKFFLIGQTPIRLLL